MYSSGVESLFPSWGGNVYKPAGEGDIMYPSERRAYFLHEDIFINQFCDGDIMYPSKRRASFLHEDGSFINQSVIVYVSLWEENVFVTWGGEFYKAISDGDMYPTGEGIFASWVGKFYKPA